MYNKENQCVEMNKIYNNVNIHIKVSRIIMARELIDIINMSISQPNIAIKHRQSSCKKKKKKK